MSSYTLEEVDGAERPWQIKRADGSIVFALTANDRSFAEKIYGNLLGMELEYLPEDADELANAA